ncbi:GAF domain-containing protein [Janibacter sp. DB-40]|uniref:helix-turn-helix domain-containing protein n=1 Tax=Janibacter sp. DB-40 TaxID=3028808 RepID=UPI002405E2BA|nr:GAF domain-containing protein [Janibacter sp. DB-40]
MTGGSLPHESVSVDAVSALLDLIVSDDASGTSIHTALAAEGISTAASEHLARQADQVRISFRRWRRREQELSAILSGVRELAELRDVDTLLERIVDRARRLLGADVAYLTGHHDNALRVRTTSGVVAPELRDLVVPVGVGLATRVVTQRTPQWTSDYQEHLEVPHGESVDKAVAAEGLRSLLGVPLLAGTEVLGALFAANRTSYEFSPDEIALLGAFADHAAIVLQTARLLETTQAAAKAAREATTVLSENLAATERASRVHEDLTSVVVGGGSAREIAETLSHSLGRRVVILGRDLVLVADAPFAGGDARAPALPTGPVREAIARSRRSGRCVPVEPDDEVEFAVTVVSDDALLGALLLGPGERELGPVERRTAERAAQIMALVTIKQDAILDAENRVSDEILSDLLHPRSQDPATITTRARGRGIHLDRVSSLVLLAVSAEARRPSLEAVRALPTSILVGEENGLLVALTSDVDAPGAADAMRQHLARRCTDHVLAVAGQPITEVEDVAAAFQTARRCAALLETMGRSDGVADVRAYTPYLAMFGAGGADPQEFIDVVVGPVISWDAGHGGDLLTTLAAFIDAQSSPTRTARRLHVHVNTVLQRLERITSLLGEDWREPELLFRISVATRMHGLIHPK